MLKFLSRLSSKSTRSEPSTSSSAGGAPALDATWAERMETARQSNEGFASTSSIHVLPHRHPLRLRTAATCLPHPDKEHYGGEDAYFVSPVGGGALGVADGVGGWAESGVNPAEYSRTLMRLACAFLEGKDIFAPGPGEEPWELAIDPRGALNAAHLNTKVAGSATACVMQLDQRGRTLHAANLGDSGFLVFRAGRAVAKSRPLQHYFDCPLQFGAYPEYVEATDTADMAELYAVPLEAGDVIVAGSDGLWDNCYETEIIELLPRHGAGCQAAAGRIAAMARSHAEDRDFPSPYTREALSQGLDLSWWDKLLGAGWRNGRFQLKQLTGGKMDDITVLVAVVEETVPHDTAGGASIERSAGGTSITLPTPVLLSARSRGMPSDGGGAAVPPVSSSPSGSPLTHSASHSLHTSFSHAPSPSSLSGGGGGGASGSFSGGDGPSERRRSGAETLAPAPHPSNLGRAVTLTLPGRPGASGYA